MEVVSWTPSGGVAAGFRFAAYEWQPTSEYIAGRINISVGAWKWSRNWILRPTASYFRRLTFNSNTKWRRMNILYSVYTNTAHTHSFIFFCRASCSVRTANDLLMKPSPGSKFHAFWDEPIRDSECVHFHTWMAPLPIGGISSSPLIPIQPRLIHDRGAAGSPEISGWVRYFPSARDYQSPPRERVEREKKKLHILC